MTDIYLISGFLGAGKTTLIQFLLQNVLDPQQTVVIENDFGETSFDAALMQAGGFTVKELNSGCICCSLTGDFIAAISEVMEEYHPKQIIIEPSGVGKLSEIEVACNTPQIAALGSIRRKITVADVLRCNMYLENFGEFYEDQIQHADCIVLSRCEAHPQRVNQAIQRFTALNPHASIFSQPLNTLDPAQLLGIPQPAAAHVHSCSCGHDHSHGECCHGHHDHDEHHHHSHENCCHDHHHDHAADDVFDTITLPLTHSISEEAIAQVFQTLEQNQMGHILRAKGMLNTPKGTITLQYLPGELQLSPCEKAPESYVCLIGNDLNEAKIKALWSRG